MTTIANGSRGLADGAPRATDCLFTLDAVAVPDFWFFVSLARLELVARHRWSPLARSRAVDVGHERKVEVQSVSMRSRGRETCDIGRREVSPRVARARRRRESA